MKVLGFAWVSILNVQSWDLHLWMWICFFVNVALVLGRSLESLGNKSRNLLRCGCTLETFQSFSIRIFRDCEKFCYSWGHERASEESTFMRWLLSASAQCRGTKSQSSKNPKDQKDRFFWILIFFLSLIGLIGSFRFSDSLFQLPSPSIRMERSRWSKSSWASQRNGQEQVRKWRTRLWQTSKIFSSHWLVLHSPVCHGSSTILIVLVFYFHREWLTVEIDACCVCICDIEEHQQHSTCKQLQATWLWFYDYNMIALVWRPTCVMRKTIQTTRPAAQSAQCHWSVMSCRCVCVCVCHCVEKMFWFCMFVSPCHVIVMSLLLVVACLCFLIAQVYMMSKSGARGNISQVRQLVAMRGLMADAKGILAIWCLSTCSLHFMFKIDACADGNFPWLIWCGLLLPHCCLRSAYWRRLTAKTRFYSRVTFNKSPHRNM